MSTEQKYCVATKDVEPEGLWFAGPSGGLAAQRKRAFAYSESQLRETKSLNVGMRLGFLRVYRAEDVLADALGIAYVRPGAEPVTLDEVAL